MTRKWEERALGEVCQIKPPKSEVRAKVSGDSIVSFVPMEDLGIDEKWVSATKTRPLSAVMGSYTYFADGDVLLAKITPCFENGKRGIATGLAGGVGFGSSEFIVFRPSAEIIAEWLYYYLSRAEFLDEGAARMSGAVGHKRVSKEFIESYRIPVPPLPEQRRIVGILDEAFAGLATAQANAEKNLQNARALLESHLNDVFSKKGEGWVETTVGGVCDFRGGGTPSKAVERYWTGKIPWVSPKDMKSEIVSDSIDHISQEAIDGSATSLIPKGAVLMVVRSGILARTVPIAVTGRELTINQDLKALCPKNSIESRFLYSLLESRMPELLSLVSRGATVHRLMTEQIRALKCLLPPKPDQLRIVEQIDAVRAENRRLAGVYERKQAALGALKKSLLHRAFAGAL